MNEFVLKLFRYGAGLAGGGLAFLMPVIPFALLCTFAVFCDCYTAWELSRRVKKRFPGSTDGKFKSNYAGRVFVTLIEIYALIIFAYLIERFIFEGLPVKLTNICAGAICFWQAWSMLENKSSCNGKRWAKIAQRILVDKTERHFDVDLTDLKEGENGKY